MTEILESTFPELTEPDASEEFNKVFMEPLFAILKEKGTNKNANAAACFCLRSFVEYLRAKQPNMVTQKFAFKFTDLAIRHKIISSNFVELLRDLMRFFDRGISGIVTVKTKALFEYSINAISTTMGHYSTIGHTASGRLSGN